MTSLTILKENLTRETFLVELSRAKGAQLVTNLVTFAWAPFHSITTSGLNFRQLPVPNGTAFSRPQCLTFLVEWFAFRKSFQKSGNFSWKILYQLPLFPKFLKFGLNGKRPKCIQEILVLRESSTRTTMCKKVCWTCKLDLLTLALPITSGWERFAWVFCACDKITLRFTMNMTFAA